MQLNLVVLVTENQKLKYSTGKKPWEVQNKNTPQRQSARWISPLFPAAPSSTAPPRTHRPAEAGRHLHSSRPAASPPLPTARAPATPRPGTGHRWHSAQHPLLGPLRYLRSTFSWPFPRDDCSRSRGFWAPSRALLEHLCPRRSFTARLPGYYSTNHSLFSKAKDWFRSFLFLWPPLHSEKLSYLFILFRTPSSIQASGRVPFGPAEAAGTRCPMLILLLLPPRVLLCHTSLFTANY